MEKYKILSQPLSLKTVHEIISENKQLELSADAIKRIEKCRDYLDEKVKKQKEPIYGVTTGFGSLCNTTISAKEIGRASCRERV